MPIQNNATFLENIVLVESARHVHETTDRAGVIDFVNSFAMPCLSGWTNLNHHQNEVLNPQRIATLLTAIPAPHPLTFAGLFRTCVAQDPNEGPNGALLVALLSRR